MTRLTFFVFLAYANLAWGKLESSPDIFLPTEQKKFVQAYQQAPLSWWNFVIFDPAQTNQEQTCEALSQFPSSDFLFNPCQNIPFSQELLTSLAEQQTWAQSPPKSVDALKDQLDRAIVTLSLPMDSQNLNLVRQFPLARFDSIAKLFSQFFSAQDSSPDVKVLPFLLSFSPESAQSEKWVEQANSLQSQTASLQWVGPHFGAQINKQQIIKDLKRVAIIGSLLIIGLILFLLLSRRAQFLLLLPILAGSIGGAFFIVYFFWGSLHGLTLAFGSGLVGISMDYAFHGWTGPFDKNVWRTNAISFLTTIMSFSLLLFFSAPLIRQISFFAIVGLTLAFSLCFAVSWFGSQKPQEPMNLPLASLPKGWTLTLLGLVVAFAAGSLYSQRLDFSLQRMDLTHSQLREQISQSGINSSKNRLGFYLTTDQDSLEEITRWAQSNRVPVLNPLSLLGKESSLDQWSQWACQNKSDLNKLSNTTPYKNLFREFLAKIQCDPTKPAEKNMAVADSLFKVGTSTLSVFKAETESEFTEITQAYPKTFFLSQLTQDFPRQLKRESGIFLVACFILSLAMLLIFFGRKGLKVFVPSIGALSGILIVTFLLGRPITFISFVSLIILLGLTLDYGIFCTAFSEISKLRKVFGSIFLSATTSLAGFAPLAFCGHPVLADLGVTITAGLLSALIFSYFVYPTLAEPVDA